MEVIPLNKAPVGMEQRVYERHLSDLTKCGINMGPHHWLPIVWQKIDDGEYKMATKFLCRTCLCQVNVSTLIREFRDLSF